MSRHETYCVLARPPHRPRVLEFEYGGTDPDTGAFVIEDFRTLTRDEAAHELRRLRRHHYVERRNHCRYFVEERLS